MFEPQQNGLSKHELTFHAIRDRPTGTEIAWRDLPYEGKVSRSKVARLMEREQRRTLVTIRGVGWKIVAGVEHAATAERERRRTVRRAGRTLQLAQSVDRREMSGEERRRTDEILIKATQAYGALRGIAARRLGMDDVRAWNEAHRRD